MWCECTVLITEGYATHNYTPVSSTSYPSSHGITLELLSQLAGVLLKLCRLVWLQVIESDLLVSGDWEQGLFGDIRYTAIPISCNNNKMRNIPVPMLWVWLERTLIPVILDFQHKASRQLAIFTVNDSPRTVRCLSCNMVGAYPPLSAATFDNDLG
ncbi:hypothetical protein M422DRAFT_244744 [Sphaerobolus stellatus SS14]|nr:hypothetical protein M422DRAFT_244744 [Sphaerobolus stellatus SS14]